MKILEEVGIWDRKVCETWRQDKIVCGRLRVVCVFHVLCNRISIMEMREGERKVMRESEAGCPVVLDLVSALWLIWRELEHMLLFFCGWP